MKTRLRPDLPLTLILVLGPLQWITLAHLGLAVKPVHLPVLWAATLGFVRPGRLVGLAPPLFATAFSAYLAALGASLFTTSDLASGVRLLAKLTLHAGLALGLTLHLARLGTRRIFDSLLLGGALGTMAFLAFASATLARQGLSLPGLIGQAISSGDVTVLQFRLFLSLFNEGGPGIERTPASLRQVAMGFFVIGALGSIPFLSGVRGRRLQVLALVTLAVSIALVAASVSRSLILALGISLTGILLARSGRRADGLLFAISGIALAVALFTGLKEASTAFDLVAERFEGLGQDGRLRQFSMTLDAIASAPVFGHGTGYMQEFRAGQQNMVHNLFLSAWVQAGAAGLLCAMVFSVTLAGLVPWGIARNRYDLWRLSAAMLPILPLLRSQVGGQGGNYALPEWLAISLALAVLCRADGLQAERQTVPSTGRSLPAAE